MDTLDWNTNLTVRHKGPIVTVRELSQDSSDNSVDNQVDSAAETFFVQSLRKRNHEEVESSSDLTTSIRKPSDEKESISPKKRHRNNRGQGSVRLQQGDVDKIRRATSVDTEINTWDKGKERIIETFNHETGSGQVKPFRLGVTSSFPKSHDNLGTEEETFQRLPPSTCENSKPNTIANKSVNVSNTPEPLQTEIQEADNEYEHVSETFESLYLLIEDWINDQRSQFDTITERINRILGLIQQGERLQQHDLTTEIAFQLENVIDNITVIISPSLDTGGRPSATTGKADFTNDSMETLCRNNRSESLIAQLRIIFETSSDSQCLTELQKYAEIRSQIDVPLVEQERMFAHTISQLRDADKKLRDEIAMIKTVYKEKLPLMLEMNSRERALISERIKTIKIEMVTFYSFGIWWR